MILPSDAEKDGEPFNRPEIWRKQMTHPSRVEHMKKWYREDNLIYCLKSDGTNEIYANFQSQPRNKICEGRWAKKFLDAFNAFDSNQKALGVAVECLESISKNSCCAPCREAGLWSGKALDRIREIQEGK